MLGQLRACASDLRQAAHTLTPPTLGATSSPSFGRRAEGDPMPLFATMRRTQPGPLAEVLLCFFAGACTR